MTIRLCGAVLLVHVCGERCRVTCSRPDGHAGPHRSCSRRTPAAVPGRRVQWGLDGPSAGGPVLFSGIPWRRPAPRPRRLRRPPVNGLLLYRDGPALGRR